MENLTINQLSLYLPYLLKMNNGTILYSIDIEGEMMLIDPNSKGCSNHRMEWGGIKPILRPLSDFTQEIEHNGEKFVPADRIDWGCLEVEYQYSGDVLYFYNMEDIKDDEYGPAIAIVNPEDPRFTEWHIMEILLDLHFDIFNLIEQDLAVDINKLDK